MQHLTQEPDLSPLPIGDRASVRRALAKEPAQRFPSCLDFVRSLAQKAETPEPARSAEAPVRSSAGSAQTPPARKALSRSSIVTTKACPRCGAPVREDSGLVLCSSCGHCSALDAALDRAEPAKDDSSWTWGLLGGVIVISGLTIMGDFLTPKNSEGRALWGLAELLIGGCGVLVSQIAAVMVMVSLDGRFDLKDIFFFSGRLWVRVVQNLPTTRWPLYLLVWGLLLAASGLFLGDVGYWTRYHRPRKPVDERVQRSLRTLDDPSAEDVPTLPSQTETTTESGAAVVQVVAVGYIPSDDGNSFSGVLMATLRNGKMVAANVVEQGYTQEKREELFRQMERLERPQPPKWWRGNAPAGVVWVQADKQDAVVCEVECQGEEDGGKMSRPRYRGLARK